MQAVRATIPAFTAALLAVGALFAPPAQAFDIVIGGNRVMGSGKVASESRALHDFQAISARGPMTVIVRQSDHEAVQISADDNVLPLVETTLESSGSGHTLVIAMKPGSDHWSSHNDIVVTVDVLTLKALSLSGSGDVKVQSLKTPALKLGLTGSADAHFGMLQADDLAISISGSGDVDGMGSAGRMKISIAGSGDVKLRSFAADDVSVDVAGSGDADITANKTLRVSIAGSGDVTYGGAAQLTRSSIAGSGSVSHR